MKPKYRKKKMINLITACDENYAKYLLPQIVSMNENIEDKVNFFFMYSRVSDETLHKLSIFCKEQKNIKFYPIKVNDGMEEFTELTQSGGGGGTGYSYFPFEVYFILQAHVYLPDWVERVLYFHSGDVLFWGDISDFYNFDFGGKNIIAESSNYKATDSEKNISLEEYYGKYGINSANFNSGTFMVNVKKMREEDYSLDFFLAIKKQIITFGESGRKKLWEGDQAFFSLAFLGNIQYFNAPLDKENRNKRSYNYSPVAKLWRAKLGQEEIKNPKIIHYDGKYKPWLFSKGTLESLNKSSINEKNLNEGYHFFTPVNFKSYFNDYWDFVNKSPNFKEIFDEAVRSTSLFRNMVFPEIDRSIYAKRKVNDLREEIKLKNSQLEMSNKKIDNIRQLLID
ncbi:glycosyltransferase family 8 protein [Lactococcus formosensis]|uniref:glycosyltransferase family 8 protein n=1 Tax=Lactococcus formosensis TaxID=1281486 RepID=UPI00325209B9